jgi:hypothetical protein
MMTLAAPYAAGSSHTLLGFMLHLRMRNRPGSAPTPVGISEPGSIASGTMVALNYTPVSHPSVPPDSLHCGLWRGTSSVRLLE